MGRSKGEAPIAPIQVVRRGTKPLRRSRGVISSVLAKVVKREGTKLLRRPGGVASTVVAEAVEREGTKLL